MDNQKKADPSTSSPTVVTAVEPQPAVLALKSAVTIEEKALAMLAYLYDKFIDKVSEKSEAERKDDVELEKKSMYIALFKWLFIRVCALLFVIVTMIAIVLLWRAGDKESAKYIVVALAGVLTGWGAKSTLSSDKHRDE